MTEFFNFEAKQLDRESIREWLKNAQEHGIAWTGRMLPGFCPACSSTALLSWARDAKWCRSCGAITLPLVDEELVYVTIKPSGRSK
jgi:hypothetical protein